MKVKTILQILSPALLFYFSQRQLHTWYLYQHQSDYWLFVVFMVSAIALCTLSLRSMSFPGIPVLRASALGIWIALCFPWPEWLRINQTAYGSYWHQDLFQQVVILYAAFAAFSLIPSLERRLLSAAARVVDALKPQEVRVPCFQIEAQAFELGLIRTGQSLLQPRMAYYRAGDRWRQELNLSEYRGTFEAAVTNMEQAGEVGLSIAAQLRKVFRRIDQDDDSKLSDQEIEHYLSDKIRILKARTYVAQAP